MISLPTLGGQTCCLTQCVCVLVWGASSAHAGAGSTSARPDTLILTPPLDLNGWMKARRGSLPDCDSVLRADTAVGMLHSREQYVQTFAVLHKHNKDMSTYILCS